MSRQHDECGFCGKLMRFWGRGYSCTNPDCPTKKPEFRCVPFSTAFGAPAEDGEVLALCEKYGFGAVMGSASRQWRARDPIGALSVGECFGTLAAGREEGGPEKGAGLPADDFSRGYLKGARDATDKMLGSASAPLQRAGDHMADPKIAAVVRDIDEWAEDDNRGPGESFDLLLRLLEAVRPEASEAKPAERSEAEQSPPLQPQSNAETLRAGFKTWWDGFRKWQGEWRFPAKDEPEHKITAYAAWQAALSPVTPVLPVSQAPGMRPGWHKWWCSKVNGGLTCGCGAPEGGAK